MTSQLNMVGSRSSLPERHGVSEAEGGRAPVLFAVDDDPLALELVLEIAQDAGWVTHGFERLSGLRRALAQRTPTVILLDDDLPDGRGGDLARELREDPRMAEATVVVCTAAHPMRQAEIGAWAPVVSKPFDLAEIESFLAGAARDDAAGYERAG